MRYLLLFGLLLPGIVRAQQANFEDDFTDKDLSEWSGTTDDFIFITENENTLLQQNADGAGVSWLSIPSANTEGYWEFFVRLDFSPADGNKAEIYLMSNNSDLTDPLNGYKLRAGEGGSNDVFRLFRITDGAEVQEVLSGTTSIATGGDFRVKVTRDDLGNWTLEVAEGYSGKLTEDGSGTDNMYSTSTHFGFKNTYTSTRSNLFFYDFKIDIPPIEVAQVTFQSATEIEIEFTRPLDSGSAQLSDFIINPGNINPQSIASINPETLLLTFSTALPSGPNQLSISDIDDASGETTVADTTFFFTVFDNPEPGDVIINEFLKDPPNGAVEYIELRNTSSDYLNLKDWKIGDSGNLTTISQNDFPLLPDSFVVISSDTGSLKSYFGDAMYIKASLPALNNGGDEIRLFDDANILVDSLAYDSDWGGVKIALERRDATVSAAYRENWGESPASNYGTPGRTNEILPDINPPEITILTVQDNQTLVVTFSERLESVSAQTVANYSLSQNPDPGAVTPALPSIANASQIAPNILQLTLDTELQEYDGTWEFHFNNLTDIFENTGSGQTDFNYFIVATARTDDVVINEFMYDPAQNYSEFVELYNHSDSTFDLQNWTFNDNTGNLRSISDDSYILSSGSFVVLAPDNSMAESFPGTPVIDMGSRFSSLNNGSDEIVIRNQHGTLIDSLHYTSDWGGKEISLERRTSNAPSFRENWGDSPSPDLGTPGKANAIAPDNEAPEIEHAFATKADVINIIFNERVDSVQATNKNNFSITPVVSISNITHRSDTVLIALSTPLTDGETYTITVKNQDDVFGNRLQSASISIEYTLLSTAKKRDVLVNEILYNKKDSGSPEFIELYNNTAQNFDLSNWALSDAVGSAVIPEGTIIRSKNYVVLTNLEEFAQQTENGVYVSGFPSLNDDEDAVIIKNANEEIIDSLVYKSIWGGNQPGVSLERKDPEAASNDGSNWASNTSEAGNSAGSQSSEYQPDELPPEIIFAKLQNDQSIFTVFSEFVNVSSAEIFVNNKPAVITNYNEANANIVVLDGTEAAGGEKITVTFNNIADVKGNSNAKTSVEAAQPVSPGSVVINEILFDPLSNSDDNLPDQTEYIELYNPADYAISLEGFSLHDEPDENHEVRSISPISSLYKWIPPNGYVIVYAEDQEPSFQESKLQQYFELPNQNEHFTVRMERSSLSLASSGDAIYLADSSGTTIDSVFYDESWQNPNLHTTKGVALEKIDPAGPGNDESNWSSSTNINGGTPGYQNSIFQKAGAGPAKSGITFTPNPFSPDNDGYEDNLFINYKLDQSDYLLRIRIFDRYGRQVRELVDGKAAGFEGSLIWDGLTNDKRKNRVGIYIVLFEAYNSAQGKNRTFKETVVLARKF